MYTTGKPLDNIPTNLYRHFGEKDALLYVGISLSAINRLRQHRDHSEWFRLIRKITIENFPSRTEAVKAEREAIKNERPRFNIQGRVTITAADNLPLIDLAQQSTEAMAAHYSRGANMKKKMKGVTKTIDLSEMRRRKLSNLKKKLSNQT